MDCSWSLRGIRGGIRICVVFVNDQLAGINSAGEIGRRRGEFGPCNRLDSARDFVALVASLSFACVHLFARERARCGNALQFNSDIPSFDSGSHGGNAGNRPFANTPSSVSPRTCWARGRCAATQLARNNQEHRYRPSMRLSIKLHLIVGDLLQYPGDARKVTGRIGTPSVLSEIVKNAASPLLL